MLTGKEKIIENYQEISEKGENKLKIKQAEYKLSLKFKEDIDKYLENLIFKILPDKDFIIGNIRIVKRETLTRLFVREYSNLSFKDRIEKIKNYIFEIVQKNSSEIIKEILSKRTQKIQKLMKLDLPIEVLKNKRKKIIHSSEELLQKVYKKDISITDSYFKNSKLKNAKYYYRKFITNFLYDQIENKEFAEFIVKNSKKIIDLYMHEYDDLAGLAYMHLKLFGCNKFQKVKHIVIDDIQELGDFEFYIIRNLI